MAYAEVNGQRIRYEDSGGDGPPVILAHGFLMDREMFVPQVEALSPEFRVITWDERGFGETEFDGKPFTYWDSASDCLGLLDHLGIERAVVGGMSQGGFLSHARGAHRAPARARAGPDRHAGRSRGPAAAARLPPDAGDLARGGTGGRAGRGDREPDHRRTGAERRVDREVAQAPAREHAGARQRLFDRDDITDRLGEIGCPALVIHGTADISIEMELAERLCQGLPGCAGVVRIEGAPHAANLTHPARPTRPCSSSCANSGLAPHAGRRAR